MARDGVIPALAEAFAAGARGAAVWVEGEMARLREEARRGTKQRRALRWCINLTDLTEAEVTAAVAKKSLIRAIHPDATSEPRGGGEGGLDPGGPHIADRQCEALCSLAGIRERARFAFFLAPGPRRGRGTRPRDGRSGAGGGSYPRYSKIRGRARISSLLLPLLTGIRRPTLLYPLLVPERCIARLRRPPWSRKRALPRRLPYPCHPRSRPVPTALAKAGMNRRFQDNKRHGRG
mmetsp:Transcript_24198/g.55061  ORF Transcript_24198/g.55061 Transcript_24198/m.55061 type:complete len:235 (-) Transcript_24198:215-919(-)